MTRSFRPADAGASGIQPESAAAQVDSASDSGTGTSRRRLLAGAGVMSLAGLAATMVDNGSASASVPATPTVPSVEGTAAASPWPKLKFVGARHGQFQLNGKPWHWGGTNCYYLHAQSHYMIDSMLNDAKAMSMQVVRAWAFFDGNTIGALQTGPYEYTKRISIPWTTPCTRPVSWVFGSCCPWSTTGPTTEACSSTSSGSWTSPTTATQRR